MFRHVAVDVVEAVIVLVVVNALLSWFPSEPGSALDRVARVIDTVTRPLLAPVRRILPPMRFGGTALDLSPVVVIVVLQVLVIVLG